MAKAIQSGTAFVPVKIRTVKDEATGETRKVEIPPDGHPNSPVCGHLKLPHLN